MEILYLVLASVFVTHCVAFDAEFLHDESFLEELDEIARSKRDTNQLPHLLNFNGSIDVTDETDWNATGHFIHNPSPTYIINLYQSLTTGYNLLHPSKTESLAIEESDTVRSFGAKLAVQNVSSDGTSAQFLAKFKLSSFMTHPEDLHLAELRVQIRPSRRHDTVEIGVHHFARRPCHTDATVFDCLVRKMLSQRQLFERHHDFYDGREVFDVTEVLRAWLTEDAQWDNNFELRTRHEFSDPNLIVDIETPTDIFSEVVLVCFSKASVPLSIHLDAGASVKVRQRRGVDRLAAKRQKKKEKEARKLERERQEQARRDKLERERLQGMQKEMESGPCRRVPMEVDFQRVGWEQWIIYPKNFNAYRCAGRCTGYLDSDDNPSNHAILVGLLRIRDKRRAPAPCCVPTKLSPLSILYFEKGSIVMKNHEDMIVQECGCR
ncbi:nodal-like [Amphiura filiformis]|uniref:nodal-like n=1 Tax=Amphiura filiformis TaxID=82378 RepID=UPI003B2261FC